MSPLISIVIPTYNRLKLLEKCLNSIKLSTYQNIEILVVDNNYNNETREYLNKNFPHIRVIGVWRNMWASWARSYWAKNSVWNWILFLDDDNIIDKRMVEYLLQDIEKDKRIWAISPVMYYLEDKSKIWFCGAIFNFNTSRPFFFKEIQSNKFYECTVIHNVYMIKRSIGDDLWWLDEELFMWYEEFDLLARIKRKWYKIGISPKAKDWHDHPINETMLRLVNTPLKAYSTIRNRVIIMKRYAMLQQFILFIIFIYPVFIIYYAYLMIREKRYDLLSSHFKWCIAWYAKIFIN